MTVKHHLKNEETLIKSINVANKLSVWPTVNRKKKKINFRDKELEQNKCVFLSGKQ